MKLVRKNAVDTTHKANNTIQKLNIDIKSYLIKYIQSYLVWMFKQNSKFVKYLSNEELSNYLVNNIELPIWFQYLLKTNTFKILTEVTNYISKYKKDSELMESELDVVPLDKDIEYTVVNCPSLPLANTSQVKFVIELSSNYSLYPYKVSYIDYELCKQIKEMNLQSGKEARGHA